MLPAAFSHSLVWLASRVRRDGAHISFICSADRLICALAANEHDDGRLT